MATPPKERDPKTLDEFVNRYELNPLMIAAIENDPRFWADLVNNRDHWKGKVSDVLGAIFKNAMNPEHPKQRDYMEWFLELTGADDAKDKVNL